MKYRIRDVINFVETSSCPTIIQSAQKLEISQPALSESLKRLEQDLGYMLFYRSRSGVKLTPNGKMFLGKAQKAIWAFNELSTTDGRGDIFSGRTIVIGCHPTVAQYSIPNALSYLKKEAPDYKVELRHDLSRNIQAQIQSGLIDVGLIINPTKVPDLVIQKLAIDTVGVWSIQPAEMFDTLICDLNLFQTQSILKKWKAKPSKVIATDSLDLICRLVGSGIGFGILPAQAVKLSGLPLQQDCSLPTFKDEICLVHRPEFGRSLPEKLTIEAIKHSMKV